MAWRADQSMARLQRQLAAAFTGPAAMACLPAICLAAYWAGGEIALIVIAAMLPITYLASGGVDKGLRVRRDAVSDLFQRHAFEELVAQTHERLADTGRHSVLFSLVIEDFDQLVDRYGQAAADIVIQRAGERIITVMRKDDHVGQMGDARFSICTGPVRHLDLETCIQIAGRLQVALEEPVSVDGLSVYVSASMGFCTYARAPGDTPQEWIAATSTALREAQHRGPSAIRAFSDQMHKERKSRADLREEVAQALDGGQIQPWFQPQISTDTGQITGFEALARWSHPVRGMISPADFLPAIEDAGLLERLAEVMMYHGFAALNAWDRAGVQVPQIGVNFAGSELSNPHLLDKVKWELDRFDLTPDRLAIEVLETVVTNAPDDVITRNINALGDFGCSVDLDDFGTGNASIASIKRFSVSRIKIDRSFVMKSDRDPEQQRMISAILTMAERLGVETLAEGVESVGEHVLLAQLGCDHVQGFGIARPMPFDQTLEWISKHNAKLQDVPRIMDGRTG